MEKFVMSLTMDVEIDMDKLDKSIGFVGMVKQGHILLSNALMDIVNCSDGSKIADKVDITEDVKEGIIGEA